MSGRSPQGVEPLSGPWFVTRYREHLWALTAGVRASHPFPACAAHPVTVLCATCERERAELAVGVWSAVHAQVRAGAVDVAGLLTPALAEACLLQVWERRFIREYGALVWQHASGARRQHHAGRRCPATAPLGPGARCCSQDCASEHGALLLFLWRKEVSPRIGVVRLGDPRFDIAAHLSRRRVLSRVADLRRARRGERGATQRPDRTIDRTEVFAALLPDAVDRELLRRAVQFAGSTDPCEAGGLPFEKWGRQMDRSPGELARRLDRVLATMAACPHPAVQRVLTEDFDAGMALRGFGEDVWAIGSGGREPPAAGPSIEEEVIGRLERTGRPGRRPHPPPDPPLAPAA